MTVFSRLLQLALAVLLLCSTLPAHAVDVVRAGSGSQAAYREQQTTSTVLMVSPDDFGFNAETAGSNLFQNRPDASSSPQKQALKEFDAMVTTLRDAGIRVIRLPSRMDARTPDAVFPNNWFSLHPRCIPSAPASGYWWGIRCWPPTVVPSGVLISLSASLQLMAWWYIG